jgi:hypothetical protein
MRPPTPRPRRRAATLVEMAFVLSIALLFLFGIFEYARYLYLQQVVTNAALDGARYAAAHTGDGTTMAQIQAEVLARMATRDSQLSGYNVTVQNVYPDTGLPVPGANWNDAPFGGCIMVQITGTFTFFLPLPSFLSLPNSVPVTATAMVLSEAN